MYLSLFVCLLLGADPTSANWPQFRGPLSLGTSEAKGLPEKWSTTENVAWKTPIPGRGWSSPIVWGDRVYLTTAISAGEEESPTKGLYFGGDRPKPSQNIHRWVVYCLDLASGKILWEKEVHRGAPEGPRHIKNSYASETPVTDGERVYAYFGNLGLFCLDKDGNQLWSQKWGAFKTRLAWGTAASPVLYKDRIYIVNDNDQESFLLALDKKTGKQIWRVERDEKSNWATPYIWENELRTEIVTPGTGKVRSYDLDGKLLWEMKGMSSIVIATPFSKFGLLYISSGYVLDRTRPIYAIRPGASGDISLMDTETSNASIAWCQRRAAPYNPSPLIYGDHIYVLYDRGFFGCYDARTGKEIYEQTRMGPGGTAFTSSPWAYNGKIFCLSEDGDTLVIEASQQYKVLGRNKLDEMCMATPALVGDRLLIRTLSALYCIRNGGK